MKALLDSSVLVAGLVRSHPRHSECRRWLARALAREIDLVLAAHSLAELHAILTTLPVRPRISPETAARLRDENLPKPARIVALDADEYRAVLDRMVELALPGGVIYDALIARVAELEAVDRLITLNEKHFRRVWPEGESRISGA